MKEVAQVKLNIYELNIFAFGFTLYHTSIEYDGVEYSYGICQNRSGVYECTPRQYPNGKFIISIPLGMLSRREFFIPFEIIRKEFLKNSYNFFTFNCNHFTNDYMKYSFNKEIPSQYQSFLKLGEFFR